VHSQGSPSQGNPELQEVDTQEEPPRSWTPSYSVHSQGSPLTTQAELVEEAPVPQSELIDDQEHEVAELEDMEFATNEEAPVANDVPAQEAASNTDATPTETLPKQTELPMEPAAPDAITEAPSEQETPSNAVEAVEVEVTAPAPDAQVPQLVLDTSDEATQVSVMHCCQFKLLMHFSHLLMMANNLRCTLLHILSKKDRRRLLGLRRILLTSRVALLKNVPTLSMKHSSIRTRLLRLLHPLTFYQNLLS